MNRADETRVDSFLKKAKIHKVLSVLVILGVVVIAIGNFTDALNKLSTFAERWNSLSDPKYAELIKNVASYAIDAEIERLSYSGDVVITPVGLFSDTGTLANGSPSCYTYLLCRFTNTGSSIVTIGALFRESRSWSRLDNLSLGFIPVLTTLAQWQRWFKGRSIEREALLESRRGFGSNLIDAVTLEPGSTKYGYIN